MKDEGASTDWVSCSAGLAPLLWVWFEVAVYSVEWGFSCWVSAGCWCLSAPHKQEVASFLINWVCLILLLELMSHVPVSSTSAKAVSNTTPSTFLRSMVWELGLGKSSSGEKELVHPGVDYGKLSALGQSRGEKRACLKCKSIWDSQALLLVKTVCRLEQQRCCLQCK